MSAAFECMREIIEAKGRAVGAQLVVATGQRIICDDAIGEARPGRPMARDTLHSLFCLTKPVVAVAACALAETHGVSLDDELASAMPSLAELGNGSRCTLREVLSHAAGLHEVRASEVMFAPRAERRRLAGQLSAAEGWRVGVDRAYSEFHGWNLLRLWIEQLHDATFGAYMREVFLDPLGIDDIYFGVDDARWLDIRDRLGVHYAMEDGSVRPMLHELLRKHLDDSEMQTIGGYGSARALARFYRVVLDGLRGAGTPALPASSVLQQMVRAGAPATVDPVLTSRVAFGLGFMAELTDTFGPAIGRGAFGHMGVLGSSFAFADPECDLVMVFVSNAFMPDDDERLASRTALVEAAYRDVLVAA